MLNRTISAIIAIGACVAVQAQGTCNIKGYMTADNGTRMVYLSRIDENGVQAVIDSAKVKKGKFTLKYKLKKGEPTLLYNITMGSTTAEVFVEPGTVEVNSNNGAVSVSGTAANDTYTQFKAIGSKECTAREAIKTRAEQLRFLIDNNASPVAPYAMEKVLVPGLSNAYAEQLVKSVSSELHSHPYYLSLRNTVLARDMREGNEMPDIVLPLRDGATKRLSDYRGKYILLDFWASWCGPCIKEMPHLQELYNETKANGDKFAIISFSLDTKAEAWNAAIEKHNIGYEGWTHASQLGGWQSQVARLLSINSIPRMILIDPEGRIISLNILGSEVTGKVKQILSGDLYYLDQEK